MAGEIQIIIPVNSIVKVDSETLQLDEYVKQSVVYKRSELLASKQALQDEIERIDALLKSLDK